MHAPPARPRILPPAPALTLKVALLSATIATAVGPRVAWAQATEGADAGAATGPADATTPPSEPATPAPAATPAAAPPAPAADAAPASPAAAPAFETAPRPSMAIRIMAELGGGAVGVAVGSLPLIAAVLAIEDERCDLGCAWSSAIWGILGYGALTLFTVPLGVYFSGEALGGDSRFWMTFLGGAAGFSIGALVIARASRESSGWSLPGFVALMGIGPVVGAITMYELFEQGDARDAGAPHASSAPRWLPTVALAPSVGGRAASGLTLGAAGNF